MAVARHAPVLSNAGFAWSSRGRIPTLDGIRAVAIVLVLVAHTSGTGALPLRPRLATMSGDIGVRIFFVLSGFLITSLLVREAERCGSVSLTRFYLRRLCRIFPAFYGYVLVVGLLAAVGVVSLRSGDLLAAATYTMNFHGDRAWWLGHLWSLSVEEQFYLLWPVALATLGPLRASRFAFGAVLLAPVIRVALWRWMPDHRDLGDQAFPCVADSLANGCLLGLAMPRLSRSASCARWLDSRWFWCVPAVGLFALATRNPWLRYGMGMTLGNIAISALILRCVARPTDILSRLLERPFLVWLGGLSYSLYVWQQPFINRHAHHWLNAFPVNVIAGFATAIGCHYLIERRFLRLNERWRA